LQLATQKLSNELAYFFSGSYLADCDQQQPGDGKPL